MSARQQLHVRKGDEVVVLTGKDKGKTGEVIEARPRENRVVVQGVNIAKKHVRASAQQAEGGITEKEMPLHVSNVAHVDPKDRRPTRIGRKFLNDGRKVRYAKRSGEVIDR